MSGAKVLVVEDNPLNLELVQEILTGEGYEVRGASSGTAAVAAVRAFGPQLILMDLQLKEEDGLTVVRRIRSEVPSKHPDGVMEVG